MDFALNQMVIRDGKGQKDRVTMLPVTIKEKLREHWKEVQPFHEKDVATGLWLCVLTRCASPEVSQRGTGMGLAVGGSGRDAELKPA